MKIRLRFTIHFIVGLLLCLLSMGITAMFSIDYLLPVLGVAESNSYYDLFVISIFFIHLIGCGIVFSRYFVRPLWFIVTWISNLTQGIYEPPGTKNKIYNKDNRLRKPFQLYEEVITNIQLLANALKESEDERVRLEENKGSWISGISHDLKTPLTYVIGYSALLLNQDYVWSSAEISSFLKEIHSKGQYIEDLIEDLNISTQMGRTQSQIPLRLEEINIVDFVQRLIAAIANDPRVDDYELSFHSEEEYITLCIDQKLIYRALMNLLVNTIEHNPAGTSIRVAITKRQDQSVDIKILDNGVGMDQSTLNDLFSEYRNAANDRSRKFGTGLGMSIARKLITVHGGSLTVESKPSEGTVFYIKLPYNLP
ncbi:sensor histidine kinase [Desulfosporosinus fructosivorans]